MTGVFGQRVSLGQANGPDVELIVDGNEWYATYETPTGYAAVYDDALGVFAYARVSDGRFESTGTPVTSPPPPDLPVHARESDDVRVAKAAARREARERQRERKGPP